MRHLTTLSIILLILYYFSVSQSSGLLTNFGINPLQNTAQNSSQNSSQNGPQNSPQNSQALQTPANIEGAQTTQKAEEGKSQSSIKPAPINTINTKADNSNNNRQDDSRKPETVTERVATNVLSSFAKTDIGAKFVQSLIAQNDTRLQPDIVAFSTNNAGIFKRSYSVKIVESPNSKIAKGSEAGKAPITICGQKIVLEYERLSSVLKKLSEGEIEYKIGASKSADLNILPVGIALGDKIQVFMPVNDMLGGGAGANSVYQKLVDSEVVNPEAVNPEAVNPSAPLANDQSQESIYNLKVAKHITGNSIDPDKIKIYDEFIGSTRPVLCGDDVKLRVVVKEINGNIIHDADLHYRVGDHAIPEIFAYIVPFMNFAGTRTVLAPAHYLGVHRSGSSKESFVSKDHDNQYVIIELSNPVLYPK